MIKPVDQKYRKWIRTQPCSNPNCYGYGDIVPAHQSTLDSKMGGKAHDKYILPLHFSEHNDEHAGHTRFWKKEADNYCISHKDYDILTDKEKVREYVKHLCSEMVKKYYKEM